MEPFIILHIIVFQIDPSQDDYPLCETALYDGVTVRVYRISEWHLHIKMVDGSSTTVTVNDPQVTQSWISVGSYDERTAQGLTTFTKHGPCCIHSRGNLGTRLVHKSQKRDTMPWPARELAHLHA